jgi:MFS superfamily sulfate permease-like transporter
VTTTNRNGDSIFVGLVVVVVVVVVIVLGKESTMTMPRTLLSSVEQHTWKLLAP